MKELEYSKRTVSPAGAYGPAVPDEAVTVRQAPEAAGVDEHRGGELAAGDVDVAHRAVQARVGDGHAVGGDAARQRAGVDLRHLHDPLRAVVVVVRRRRLRVLRAGGSSNAVRVASGWSIIHIDATVTS